HVSMRTMRVCCTERCRAVPQMLCDISSSVIQDVIGPITQRLPGCGSDSASEGARILSGCRPGIAQKMPPDAPRPMDWISLPKIVAATRTVVVAARDAAQRLPGRGRANLRTFHGPLLG